MNAAYLTRALIGASTLYSRGLFDAYAWHQLVWQSFPELDGLPRDFLTRLDDKPTGTQLLIVSPTEPSRPKWLADTDEWQTKQIPPDFFSRRFYRFQLHANPTVKRVVRFADGQRKKNGRRVGISDKDELLVWLQKKGSSGGFSIPAGSPLEIFTSVTKFQKTPQKGLKISGTHYGVDFEGTLQITDPSLFFQQTFSKGIGSAKAFGFGLLVLAPLS